MRRTFISLTTFLISLSLLTTASAQTSDGSNFMGSGFEAKNTKLDTRSINSSFTPRSGKLTAGNAVIVSYPSSVKLKKKGCQKIKISYSTFYLDEVDEVWVWILDDNNEFLAQELIYETPLQAAQSGLGPWKKTGKASVKICRKAWDDSWGDSMLGAKKGKFQIFVDSRQWEATSYISFK
jgi:hypothetical protein